MGNRIWCGVVGFDVVSCVGVVFRVRVWCCLLMLIMVCLFCRVISLMFLMIVLILMVLVLLLMISRVRWVFSMLLSCICGGGVGKGCVVIELSRFIRFRVSKWCRSSGGGMFSCGSCCRLVVCC